MDEAIVRASRLAREEGLTAVLDTEESLFGADSCPAAAVYWGWYSLAKYVDSFTFKPGAVAVHVASGECNSLRSGDYWCRNLISNGAAVTMGPTNEPYLEGYPHPDDFLGALFEGKNVGEWATRFTGHLRPQRATPAKETPGNERGRRERDRRRRRQH
jgi:uncharacterized protein (TIGR03790 family)